MYLFFFFFFSHNQSKSVNNSEPVRFGFRATLLRWLEKIDLLCLFVLAVLLSVLYNATSQTKRCKYNVPGTFILFWDLGKSFCRLFLLACLYWGLFSSHPFSSSLFPELYWTSMFFMLYCFSAVALLGLVRMKSFIYQDADPGKCNKSCQGK